MVKKILFTLFCIALTVGTYAQVSFSLIVNERSMTESDQITVVYRLQNADNNPGIQPIRFNDWQVLAGPQSSSTISVINNKKYSYYDYIYVLSPKRTGTLTIPAAQVMVNGTTLRTSAITIQVTKGNSRSSKNSNNSTIPRMGGSIFDMFDDFFDEPRAPNVQPSIAPGQSPADFIKSYNFIKVTPSKRKCYVGEPILVNYDFYSGIGLREAKVIKQPSFNGASVIESTDEKPSYRKNENGHNYIVSKIREVQLIPLKTGTIILEPAEVSASILVSEQYGVNSKVETTTIKNAPSEITVQPLPSGSPANFKGNVGQFTIEARVDKNSVPVGENNILTIRISGNGNFDGIQLPNIIFPDNIQSFSATDSQSVNKNIFPIQGLKQFKIPFIGKAKGNATIPAIQFAYFDPIENKYKVVSTDSILIDFTPPLPERAINSIISKNGFTAKIYIWLIGVLAIIAGMILYFIFRKPRKKATEQNKVKQQKTTTDSTKDTLSTQHITTTPIVLKPNLQEKIAALENIIATNEFYSNAKKILLSDMQYRLIQDTASEYILIEALLKSSMNEVLKKDYQKLLKKINNNSYLPIVNIAERKQVLGELKYLISQ